MEFDISNHLSKMSQAQNRFFQALKMTNFLGLENAVSNISLLTEKGEIDFKNGKEALFAEDIFSRCISETFAFCSCLRYGAFYPSYHHLRAMMEFGSVIEFIAKHLDDPEQWLERYVLFPDIRSYKYNKNLPKKERIASQSQIDNWAQSIGEWERVFGKKQQKITKWHSPKSVSQIIEIRGSKYLEHYGRICHFTHFCSLGMKASRKNLIGFPEMDRPGGLEKLKTLINSMISELYFALISLGKHNFISSKKLQEYTSLLLTLNILEYGT